MLTAALFTTAKIFNNKLNKSSTTIERTEKCDGCVCDEILFGIWPLKEEKEKGENPAICNMDGL